MGDNKISEAVLSEPLRVFSEGTWLYGVTGQQFSAADLDEAAFVSYSPHLQGEAVPVEFDYPEFHAQGMGCGLEDRNITDRYEAMRYGFDEALDQMATILDSIGPLYTHPQPAELSEQRPGALDVSQVALFVSTLRQDLDDGMLSLNRSALKGILLRLESALDAIIPEDAYEAAVGMFPGSPAQRHAFMAGVAHALAATGKQQVGEVHPDDAAVDAFAAAMKAKMAAARAKGRSGWEDPAQCSAEDLSRMLRDHVEKGDPRDVANFCMMLHQRGEAITPIQPVGQEPVARIEEYSSAICAAVNARLRELDWDVADEELRDAVELAVRSTPIPPPPKESE